MVSIGAGLFKVSVHMVIIVVTLKMTLGNSGQTRNQTIPHSLSLQT